MDRWIDGYGYESAVASSVSKLEHVDSDMQDVAAQLGPVTSWIWAEKPGVFFT